MTPSLQDIILTASTMIIALSKLGPRALLSVVPKATAAQSVVLRTSTKVRNSISVFNLHRQAASRNVALFPAHCHPLLTTSSQMATSDDERWPDPSNYPRGEKLDHLQELRAKRSGTKQDEKPLVPVDGDEHSTFQASVPNVEELKLHAQEEKMKKDKEDVIRHHAWE